MKKVITYGTLIYLDKISIRFKFLILKIHNKTDNTINFL